MHNLSRYLVLSTQLSIFAAQCLQLMEAEQNLQVHSKFMTCMTWQPNDAVRCSSGYQSFIQTQANVLPGYPVMARLPNDELGIEWKLGYQVTVH